MFAALFVLLYVSHLLADFPLQTDHQAHCKAGWTEGDQDPEPGRHHHGWGANLAHAGTHVAVSAAVLAVGRLVIEGFTLGLVPAAVGLVLVGVTHSVIDRRWPVARWMAFARQTRFAQHGGAAHVDQTFHVAALVIAAFAMSGR